MKALAAVALGVLFVIGAVVGALLGALFFWVALLRAGRPVHKEGVVCRAELLPRDPVLGAAFAGPTLVRLSGAFADQRTREADVLGVMLRMRRADQADSNDPTVGDQDLLLGTFESFRTAARDRAATDISDYLTNHYSTVTPWWVSGHGPATLRLNATAMSVSSRRSPPGNASPADARSGDLATAAPTSNSPGSRLERLDAALAADQARLTLVLDRAGSSTEIAELRLIERTSIADHHLQASMFRCKRGLRPVGFRNGIRATLYPMSQLGRHLRTL